MLRSPKVSPTHRSLLSPSCFKPSHFSCVGRIWHRSRSWRSWIFVTPVSAAEPPTRGITIGAGAILGNHSFTFNLAATQRIVQKIGLLVTFVIERVVWISLALGTA